MGSRLVLCIPLSESYSLSLPAYGTLHDLIAHSEYTAIQFRLSHKFGQGIELGEES